MFNRILSRSIYCAGIGRNAPQGLSFEYRFPLPLLTLAHLDRFASQGQPGTSPVCVQALQEDRRRQPDHCKRLQANVLSHSDHRFCWRMVSGRVIPDTAINIAHTINQIHCNVLCPPHRDTVASVGLIMGRTLPFTTSNTIIKTFRHALSLDEVSSSAPQPP